MFERKFSISTTQDATETPITYVVVWNFSPSQYPLLQSRMKNPLVTNQIEVSLNKLDSFVNRDLDFLYQSALGKEIP